VYKGGNTYRLIPGALATIIYDNAHKFERSYRYLFGHHKYPVKGYLSNALYLESDENEYPPMAEPSEVGETKLQRLRQLEGNLVKEFVFRNDEGISSILLDIHELYGNSMKGISMSFLSLIIQYHELFPSSYEFIRANLEYPINCMVNFPIVSRILTGQCARVIRYFVQHNVDIIKMMNILLGQSVNWFIVEQLGNKLPNGTVEPTIGVLITSDVEWWELILNSSFMNYELIGHENIKDMLISRDIPSRILEKLDMSCISVITTVELLRNIDKKRDILEHIARSGYDFNQIVEEFDFLFEGVNVDPDSTCRRDSIIEFLLGQRFDFTKMSIRQDTTSSLINSIDGWNYIQSLGLQCCYEFSDIEQFLYHRVCERNWDIISLIISKVDGYRLLEYVVKEFFFLIPTKQYVELLEFFALKGLKLNRIHYSGLLDLIMNNYQSSLSIMGKRLETILAIFFINGYDFTTIPIDEIDALVSNMNNRNYNTQLISYLIEYKYDLSGTKNTKIKAILKTLEN